MKNRIYAKADEKFVTTTILYAGASDKLFYNEDGKTEPVKTAELKELFLQGVTIHKNGTFYRAIALKSNGLIGHDGAAAATFTAA